MTRHLRNTLFILAVSAVLISLSACRTGYGKIQSTEEWDEPLTRPGYDEYGEVQLHSGDPDPEDEGDDSPLPSDIPDLFHAEWPDNEFTDLVPQPDFKIYLTEESEDSVTIIFTGADAEEIRAYAEELQKAGFTVDPDTEDQNAYGMEIYSYSASNEAGYYIQLVYSAGTSTLHIGK